MQSKRNGFQSFLRMCHAMCVFFGRWRGPVQAAIAATDLSAENKAKLLAAMASIDAACAVVDLVINKPDSLS